MCDISDHLIINQDFSQVIKYLYINQVLVEKLQA